MSGIYLHIPFCKSKCAYCNFFSLVTEKKIDDYVLALKKEIINRKSYLGDDVVKTIYFGGGTPSLLPIKYVEEILELLHKNSTRLILTLNGEMQCNPYPEHG